MWKALALASLLAATSGCFLQNIGSDQKLRESVTGLNDEMRWTRMDLAMVRVVPAYREEFAGRRAEWGRRVRIADSEPLQMQVGEDSATAMSVMSVSWVDESTMELKQTTIKQEWLRVGGNYMLSGEEVTAGDESLLAVADAGGETEESVDPAGDEEPVEPTTAEDSVDAESSLSTSTEPHAGL